MRSLRIYYGDRQHGPAMDRLYREFRAAARSRIRHRRARGRSHCRFSAGWAHGWSRSNRSRRCENLAFLYGGDPMVTIEAAAVGRQPGAIELNVNVDNPTVSTASTDFIAAAANAPGWEGQAWSKRIRVPLTTIDALIARHGRPAFIKIDVEGFEAEALAGLRAKPSAALSFELTLIQRDIAHACIERCGALGYAQVQCCTRREPKFRTRRVDRRARHVSLARCACRPKPIPEISMRVWAKASQTTLMIPEWRRPVSL